MKKLLSVLLVVFLLAVFSNSAFAQEAPDEPQLVVSTVQANPGDEVSIDISIRNNPGIGVINPKFVFDESRLEWIGYEQGGLTGWTVTKKAGVWLGNEDSHFDGVILTLRFRVLESAPAGFTEIGLICGDGDAYNYAEELILFRLVSGGVQIGSDATSPSPAPAAGGAGGSASPSPAPQQTPAVESPAPEANENAAFPEEDPVPAEELGPSSAEKPAVSDGSAEPEAATEEDSLSKTPSTPRLPVALACCAILALVVILFRRTRNNREKQA